MKKIEWVLMLMLLLAIACTDKREKALVRRWRVADVIFLDDKQSVVQSDTMQGNMMQRQRAVMRDVLTKNLYEFKADGTYITGNVAATSTGKWNLQATAIEFISDGKEGNEQKTKSIPVQHLSEDSLVLVLNNDQTSVKLKLLLLPTE
jgi:hypothetical protein